MTTRRCYVDFHRWLCNTTSLSLLTWYDRIENQQCLDHDGPEVLFYCQLIDMICSSLSLLYILSALGLVTIADAQRNVTVNNTSPLITYGGNAGDAAICKYNPDGTLTADQPGCYNVPSLCAASISVGQGGSGTATFSFKGSAVYINSVLDQLSPIFTVTLDGKATDVDGVRDSRAFSCYTLFSQTGLDPTGQHQIKLSVKGPSPNRNISIPNSDSAFVFSLVNFVYTTDDVATKVSSTTKPVSSSSGSNSAPNATSSGASNGAELCHFPGLLTTAAIVVAAISAWY